jgi:hypothetical protein
MVNGFIIPHFSSNAGFFIRGEIFEDINIHSNPIMRKSQVLQMMVAGRTHLKID